MARHVAAVLAAGQGKRMNTSVAKQYLLIKGKPVLYYALQEFEICPFISEIVIVAGADDIVYCRHEIVEKYGIFKAKKIVPGGKERYHSVYNALQAIGSCDYVYIHDGARPFITQDILQRVYADVTAYGACAAGMPVKDTIKICDEQGFSAYTPDRSLVWQMQTPQAFDYTMICSAYERLMRELAKGSDLFVTDDAMVAETMLHRKVKLTKGSYTNLKITTPDDLKMAEELICS